MTTQTCYTESLHLACFLLTKHHKLSHSEPVHANDGRRFVRFHFISSTRWEQDCELFWNNADTPIGSYNLAMKRLKSEIRKHWGTPQFMGPRQTNRGKEHERNGNR